MTLRCRCAGVFTGVLLWLLATSIPTVVVAQEDVVTQRAYADTAAPRAYITAHPTTILQRLSLPAQAIITRLHLELSGIVSDHAATIQVYGHEGGLLVPRLGRILASKAIRKTVIGRERIAVDIHPAVVHAGGQLFVGVADVAEGIRVLLVDDRLLHPCTDDAGLRGPTVFTTDKVKWSQTSMPMALSVTYDVPERLATDMFALDTTIDAVADRVRAELPYVTSGDVDGDGYPEVAGAGVLFKNDRGRLQAIDLQDTVSYPLIYFVDVDGDGRDEVLTADVDRGGSIALWQWHGRRLSLLHRSSTVLSGRIVSMTTLSEGAGATLVAVVEGSGDGRAHVISLQADGQASVAMVDHERNMGVTSVLAADVTGDGRRELMLRRHESDVVLAGTVGGGFDIVAERMTVDSALAHASASILADSRQGVDVMVPTAVDWRRASHRPDVTVVKLDSRMVTLFDELPDWDERPSAVIDVDMTGDGRNERLVFGDGKCRALRVFERIGETWADVTYRLGLDGLRGASDGLVVDLNQDGCGELVVDRDGRFEVYRRPCSTLTPLASEQRRGVGNTTAVYQAAAQSYGRGRGRMIQEPRPSVMRTTQVAQDSSVMVVRGDASGWYVDGISGATEIDVVMTTLSGSVVYSGRLPVEGGTARLRFPAGDLASGTYSIVVSAGKNIINHVIHLLK